MMRISDALVIAVEDGEEGGGRLLPRGKNVVNIVEIVEYKHFGKKHDIVDIINNVDIADNHHYHDDDDWLRMNKI